MRCGPGPGRLARGPGAEEAHASPAVEVVLLCHPRHGGDCVGVRLAHRMLRRSQRRSMTTSVAHDGPPVVVGAGAANRARWSGGLRMLEGLRGWFRRGVSLESRKVGC